MNPYRPQMPPMMPQMPAQNPMMGGQTVDPYAMGRGIAALNPQMGQAPMMNPMMNGQMPMPQGNAYGLGAMRMAAGGPVTQPATPDRMQLASTMRTGSPEERMAALRTMRGAEAGNGLRFGGKGANRSGGSQQTHPIFRMLGSPNGAPEGMGAHPLGKFFQQLAAARGQGR